MKFLHCLTLLLAFFTAANCSRQEGQGQSIPVREEQVQAEAARYAPEEAAEAVSPAWPLLTMLIPGDNPIWFELNPQGPLPVESPALAYMIPYTPWPQARFISGMQVWQDFLVIAVNREGFLILGFDNTSSENTIVLMYQAGDSALWDAYTTESLFIWDDRPAALLYRNDFFAYENPDYEIPHPLVNQVYVLDLFSPVPLAARVPALESYPAGGPWETERLHRGPDDQWYYRIREKGTDRAGTAFFRTGDLSGPGIQISESEWRDSFSPEDDIFEQVDGQLPALPEDFAYTGLAVLGNTLVASWEEQQLHTIGAAGFMVKRLGNIDN